MNVAIIPARGGSKRVPRKNIRAFCGKPMLAWSVEAALASGCFDRIVVSTDDDEIADVALAHGIEVPFRRPAELADDHAGTVAVIAHAVRWLQASGTAVEFACCLYATAPFVTAQDLRDGLAALQATDADYAFPVTHFDYPPQRALRLDGHGRARLLQPELAAARSQDLEPAWHDAGQFYWGRAAAWLAGTSVFAGTAMALPRERHRVQDIDTEDDWRRAEAMFRALAGTA
jgi:N-acylneuraminate cytidylyltransferase